MYFTDIMYRVSMQALTNMACTVRGEDGPFVAQRDLIHLVKQPHAASISEVQPSRIASADPYPEAVSPMAHPIENNQYWKSPQYSVPFTFVGADFSPQVYVALTTGGGCDEEQREYITALASGVGTQATAVRLSIRYPGTYRVCYSASGNSSASLWVLQQVEVSVIAAAFTGAVRSLKVCTNGGADTECVEDVQVRVPSSITFSFQFLGLDYSRCIC
jgi:hypothetical protein